MKNKAVKILAVSFVLILLGFLAFLFVNCVISYNEYDLDYGDLKYAELTFKSYRKIDGAKSSEWYEIFFTEHEKPFQIDSISEKGVDEKALEKLSNYETVKVYYRDNSSKKYDFEICEMQSGSGVIFGLSDYVKLNRNNQILGMIITSVMALGVLFCAWTYPRSTNPPLTKKKSKKSKKKSQKSNKKSNKTSVQNQKAKRSFLPEKTVFAIIALAYLHRYGWIGVMFGFMLAFPRASFYIFSIGFIAFSIWSFVGYKCRWRHIFCSYQNAYHMKMTPDYIDWDWVEKKDAYGVPLIFMVLGLACLCVVILSLN